MTANIISETIISNAEQIARVLKMGGVLIASGITTAKSLNVEQSLRNAGFDIVDRPSEGEWVALVAIKGS
jgi:ribosomal protein L11 methyltransferase